MVEWQGNRAGGCVSRAGRVLSPRWRRPQDALAFRALRSLCQRLCLFPTDTMAKAVGVRGGRAAPCPSPRPSGSVSRLLLDISLARLLLATLEVALGPITAALGPWRLACRLLLALRRLLLRSIGYMAAPAQLPALRQLSAPLGELRRWHVAAGEADRRRGVRLPIVGLPCGRCP